MFSKNTLTLSSIHLLSKVPSEFGLRNLPLISPIHQLFELSTLRVVSWLETVHLLRNICLRSKVYIRFSKYYSLAAYGLSVFRP